MKSENKAMVKTINPCTNKKSFYGYLDKFPFLYALRDIKTKRPSSGENLDVLDGIRGFALLLVIASHTNGFNLSGQGGLGVWIFFTLSGFLLTYQNIVKRKDIWSRKNLKKYLSRRINRIFPMYYFILTVVLVFKTGDFSKFLQHILFFRADGHFWIIPQELLFYILLPILLYLLNKALGERYLTSAFIMIAIGLLTNILLRIFFI
jgi:peptidoglycan/LPS O-acetylase OafA/YrhL